MAISCSPLPQHKTLVAALLAAMLRSLTACGKLPFLGKSDQDTSVTENTDETVDTTPSADTYISTDEDTAEGNDASTNGDTSVDDSWKVEFAENHSGSNFERLAFKQMLEDIDIGRIEMFILTAHLHCDILTLK